MKERRMARPSDYVTSFDRGIAPSTVPIGDTLRVIAALEKRRIVREKLKSLDVVVGTYFRIDMRWFRVIEKVPSPYGSRWKVSDVAAPDAPSQVVAWSDVRFVSAATASS